MTTENDLGCEIRLSANQCRLVKDLLTRNGSIEAILLAARIADQQAKEFARERYGD